MKSASILMLGVVALLLPASAMAQGLAAGRCPPNAQAPHCAPQVQQVFVVRIDRPKINLPNGSIATVTPVLINTGRTLRGATVAVSLYRGGNFIDEQVFANQTLLQNVEMPYTLVTIPLMQGSYTIKVLVLSRQGEPIQSFPDLGTIAVDP